MAYFHSMRFTIILIGAVVFYVSVGFRKVCFASKIAQST